MSIASRYAGQATAEQASQDQRELARLRARVTELETERDALLKALPEQRRQT